MKMKLNENIHENFVGKHFCYLFNIRFLGYVEENPSSERGFSRGTSGVFPKRVKFRPKVSYSAV